MFSIKLNFIHVWGSVFSPAEAIFIVFFIDIVRNKMSYQIDLTGM